MNLDSHDLRKGRVLGSDSVFWGCAMPRPCSSDLRERVIEAVEEGASRREAAERFEVSASSAVRWFQAWQKEGRRAPRPCGGSQSPLGGPRGPDPGSGRCAAGLYARRVRRGHGQAPACRQPQRALAVSGAPRHQRQKKACGQPSKIGRTWPALGGAGSGSRAGLIRPPSSSSTKPRRTPGWLAFMVDARGASD